MSLLDHSRDNCLGNDERSVQVYINDFAEFICLHLEHWLSHDDTGVVYKDIDHSDFLVDLSDHSLYLLLVCDITYIAVSLDASLFVGSKPHIYLLLIDIIEADRCARLSVSRCDAKSDPVGCACYKCDFAFQ